jgi:hypothetical protein
MQYVTILELGGEWFAEGKWDSYPHRTNSQANCTQTYLRSTATVIILGLTLSLNQMFGLESSSVSPL